MSGYDSLSHDDSPNTSCMFGRDVDTECTCTPPPTKDKVVLHRMVFEVGGEDGASYIKLAAADADEQDLRCGRLRVSTPEAQALAYTLYRRVRITIEVLPDEEAARTP